MKISKIIFISYFSVIGIFLLGFLIVGFAFNSKEINKKNVETKTQTLAQFKHVSIGEGCRVSIQNYQESKLTYISSKDSVLIKPVYEIKNDTLFINSTKNNMRYSGVVLYSNNITSITGKSCDVNLREMNQEALDINTYNTRIDIDSKTRIKRYNISLKQSSKLNCWNNFKGEELLFDAEKSTLNLRSQHRFNKIKGKATNYSKLQLPEAKSYELDMDDNSTLKIY